MVPLIILVDQSGLVLAAPNLSDVVRVAYPPNTVQELELIKPDNLRIMIEQMIKQYQLLPAEAVVILDSSVYFQKEVPTLDPVEQDQFVKDFENSVPLGSVFVRKYQLDAKTLVIAFNKQFYKELIKSLTDHGFTPKALVPDVITSQQVGGSGLTMATAELIGQTIDKLRKYSLLSPADTAQTTTPQVSQAPSSPIPAAGPSQPAGRTRIYLMAAVFIGLIAVMIWMLVSGAGA